MNRLVSCTGWTVLFWLAFLGGTAMLLVVDSLIGLPLGLSIIWLLALLMTGCALLIRYIHFVAQWRGIILFWGIFTLAQFTAAACSNTGWPIVTTAAVLVVMYTMLAGWVATIALAIRRDVSVAYFALFFLIIPIVFRLEIANAGGVLVFLQGQTIDMTTNKFALSETLVMATVLMPPIAILTFVPHFLALWVKEWRRAPLQSSSPFRVS